MGLRVTVLLLLTSWTLLDCHAASQNDCERGWFGSSCQYKCRCRSDNCSPQGDCPDGVACEVGWFGPACQYADLAYRARTSHPKATDGDDSSCLTPPGVENVEITLNHSSHFTWLRIRYNNPDLIYNLTVHFRGNANFSCTNPRTARVDNTTLDIHCDLNETVNQVILSGNGVQHLCSVYISGGRNVALKQNATESSVYSGMSRYTYRMNISLDATKAVDGNRDGRFYYGNTCTHTDTGQPDPNLNVTFSRLQYITRYVLYNRIDNEERLRYFELRSFNDDLVTVLDYKDNSTRWHFYDQRVYTVTPNSVASPIRLVNIKAHNDETILTVCELEVYGVSVLPLPAATTRRASPCYMDNTITILGQVLLRGSFTTRANMSPSLTSSPTTCTMMPKATCSVIVLLSCPLRLLGTRVWLTETRFPLVIGAGIVDTACETGSYGRDCEHTCHCVGGQSCFVSTGACPSGCAASFMGQDCSTRCDQGRYGPGCQLSCSQFCVRGNDTRAYFCNNTDGACLHGCVTGYQGSTCSQELPMNVAAVVVPVIVGVGVLVLVVVAVVFLRRRNSTKSQTRGDSPAKSRGNISLSRNDNSKVEHTLSDGGYESPGVSKAVTQRAAQIGSHGKFESEDIFGYASVGQSCDDSEVPTYEDIDDNMANPYEDVDDSNKDITPTRNCPQYANTP